MVQQIFRWLALTGMLLSPFGQAIPAFAASPFSDVPSGAANAQAITVLKADGVLEGYADGTFRPKATINRAELLKIILEARDDVSLTASKCFPDVQDQWYAAYVCAAKAEGIVSGYDDGLFRPEKPVNFVEASKIFSLAYKQQASEGGAEWYVQYVKALEGSKAIPASINALTENLTRGDMAEIMWRLSKGVTDQPSVGYLNVKYPGLSVNLSSEKVQTAQSCADLQAFASESNARGGWGIGGGRAEMDESVTSIPLSAPAPQAMKSANEADGSYSRTNVQVEGVDEADIVKTDGTYLYIVSGRNIRIVKAQPANDMKEMSTLFDEDSTFSPSEVYVQGDRLVAIGSVWTRGGGDVHIMEKRLAPSVYPYYPDTQRLQARIYDVSDRSNPKLERKVSFDGSAVSTRMIGTKLYLVVNQPMRWIDLPLLQKGVSETDVLPTYSDSKDGDVSKPVARCGTVTILPREPNPQYLTVGVIDIARPTSEVQKSVVLGNATNVYASLQNLYVASPEWIYHWDSAYGTSEEKTNVYRFAFTANGTEMKSQGSVPGRILNQFSMDENGNNFRIATTKGYAGNTSEPSSNNLYVLNMGLETVGKITDIAPGEQIYATRFIGDRAYMVTFQQTDPLFVIDTSDPRNPKILGKLKIPGYSNYLHPYDENHLIGFGKEAVEAKEGSFAWYQGMKVAIFDVTDVSNPKELHNEVIGDRGTWSPLLDNHKALLFEKDKNLLSFPVTVYKIPSADKQANNPSAYGSPVFQGAYVYTLTLKDGFQLKGKISHYDEEAYLKSGDRWYGSTGEDIQRVVRVSDSLYTISEAAVQSNALGNLSKQDRVDFPREQSDTYPCGRGVPCPMF